MKKSTFLGLFVALSLSFVFLTEYTPTIKENSKTACALIVGNLILEGHGTSTFINNKNNLYILTCAHVVSGRTNHELCWITSDNIQLSAPVNLVIISKSKDFAILEVPGKLPLGGNIAKYRYSDNLELGSSVYYFGLFDFPAMKPQLNMGPVSRVGLKGSSSYFNCVGVPVTKGSSGATVFDKDGYGIGIVCLKLSEGQMAYLPIQEIRQNILDSDTPEIIQILEGTYTKSLSKERNNKVIILK